MSALEGLSPSERKRALAALFACAVVLAGLAVALPVWLINERYGAVLEDMSGRLERYQRQAAARPELERKLEGVRAQGSRRFFLKASAGSLAAAEVQERVRQIVDGNGGRVVSVQVGQPKDEGPFRQVTVTVQLNATIGSLQRTLVALEGSEPLLLIDSLTVRSQVPPNFRPAPGFDPELFIQLDVSGFAVTG